MIPIYEIVFYLFAAIMVFSAVMVIVSKQPVTSVMFLVATFFCAAVLWIMMHAEFLALVLIFVYVGAVMTLFLFVVMMLNIDLAPLKEGFVRFLPLGIIVLALFMGIMIYVVGPGHAHFNHAKLIAMSADYSNTKTLGKLLFTKYIYPFEIAGAILLVAIIGAISLAFFGRRPGTKAQDANAQVAVKRSDRVRLVEMKAEQKHD